MSSADVPVDRVRVGEDRAAGTGVLAAACISALVVNANTSAVTILLPAISNDVNAPVAQLQWAVTGYSLVGAAVIVTSGALGDVFGRRRLFLGGLALFIASCVFIALSTSGPGVVIGRMIQGASGATILACGMSLLSVASSGAGQMRAITIWGAASAVGAAAGPLVGGVLVDVTGWQGLFWIDAGIAAACVPLTLKTVQESRDPNRSHSIDYAGTVLIAVILVPLVLALSKGNDWGWASLATIGSLIVSVVATFAFVAVERRVKAPLVDLALLKNQVLVGATLAILIVAGAINALMYVISLYFQDPAALGLSALQAGLATLPAAAGMIAVTPLITPLAVKIGTRLTIIIGFALSAVGFAGMTFVTDSWAYAAFIAPLVVIAVGLGVSNGPASSASTAFVAPKDVGAASGISNMARYIGAAVAVAAVATIYNAVTNNHLHAGASKSAALAAGLTAASLMLAIVCGAGILLATLMARHRPVQPQAIHKAAAAAATTHTIPTAPVPRLEHRFREGVTMPADDLQKAIRDLMPRARDDLAELVAFKSVADPAQFPPEECRHAAQWVIDAFAQAGLQEVTMSPTPDGSMAVHGHSPAPDGAPTVLLYCHYDVQPPLGGDKWHTPIFELTEKDGRWYGRGAADCKGNVVMHLTALRALRQVDGSFPCGIKLISEGSEEQGTGGLEAFVPDNADLLRADTILVCDTGNAAVGIPTLTTTLRGMTSVDVTLEGLGSAMHSGMFGGSAPDPVLALIQMLATLHDEHGNTTIDGLDSSQKWTGVEYSAEQFRVDANVLDGVQLMGDGAVADMLWARPSATVLGIDIPPVVGSSAAIQPSVAARVSLRLPPGMSGKQAQDALVEHLKSRVPWGVRCTIERVAVGDPFVGSLSGPGYESMHEAMREAYGREQTTKGQGGSIPLCNVFAETFPDAEIMLMGVEEPRCLIHAPNESVDPSEIENLALSEALFLQKYAKAWSS